MTAKVQIVLPSFNRPKLVQEVIKRVQAQTMKDWKLYIMDNSSPNLWPTMQQVYLQYPDSRIKIDHTEVPLQDRYKKIWIAVVTNKALFTELSEKEPYVVLSTDDDLMMPNKLELLTNFLDTHPEANMVSGVMELINPDGKPIRWNGGANYRSAAARIDWMQPMYRRGLLDKIGMLPTEMPLPPPGGSLDIVLFHRAAEITDCCYGIPVALDRQPELTCGKGWGGWSGRALNGEVME